MDARGQRFYALEELSSLNTIELITELVSMGVVAVKIEGSNAVRPMSNSSPSSVARRWVLTPRPRKCILAIFGCAACADTLTVAGYRCAQLILRLSRQFLTRMQSVAPDANAAHIADRMKVSHSLPVGAASAANNRYRD
jgi:hypothetical protein